MAAEESWPDEVTVESWAGFVAEVDQIDRRFQQIRSAAGPGLVQPPIWRGQSNAAWVLQTTLERFAPQCQSLAEYYRAAYSAKPEIEAFTGREWNLGSDPWNYERWASQYDDASRNGFPGYEYLAHLRHYDFPSPLLDWSRSPYVAAFFALSEPRQEDASVFVYLETTAGIKSHSSDEAQIKLRGPYVRAPKRHFLQQALYTICIRYEERNLTARWYYTSHQEVFDRHDSQQDVIKKIILRASMRQEALRQLDRFNINAFSLYGSEEGLMQSMARRELLRPRDGLAI